MSARTHGRVELGRISGAHGLRGQVRVVFFGDDPENVLGCSQVWIASRLDDPNARQLDVVSRGMGGRPTEIRLGLRGIEDRNAAQALRGLLVLGSQDELPELEDGEFYWHELIGCQVEDTAGRQVGEVIEIWGTGAHDVLVVEDEKGRRHLIPTAQELVPEIDTDAGRIVIADLPGLVQFDTDSVEPEARSARAARKEEVVVKVVEEEQEESEAETDEKE